MAWGRVGQDLGAPRERSPRVGWWLGEGYSAMLGRRGGTYVPWGTLRRPSVWAFNGWRVTVEGTNGER